MPTVRESENPVLLLIHIVNNCYENSGRAIRKGRLLLELKIFKCLKKGAGPKYILYTHQNTFIELV